MKGKILATAMLALLAVSALLTVIPCASAATATFGQSTVGSANTALNTILGTKFTTTTPGQATSINAYLSFTQSTGYFGQQTEASINYVSIENSIRGQAFTTPASPVIATSISARIYTTWAHEIKAAIYDSTGHIVAQSNAASIPIGTADRTFTLTSPTLLSASTTYYLVVWAKDATLNANLVYNNGGNGQVASASYGSWPTTVSFSPQADRNYFIWCNYQTTATTQCAIYSADGTTQLGITEQKSFTSTLSGSWISFNLNTPVALAANTPYILAAYSSNSGAKLFSNGVATQAFKGSGTFSSTALTSSGTNSYNLYTTIQYHNIMASAGTGGSISPTGCVMVANGASQTFTITPNTGYHVTNIKVDGSPVVADTSYTFPSVSSDHTIEANFAITQVATSLTVACTPDTVDKSGSMITTVTGTLTTSGGAPIAGQQIALTYNDGTQQPITTATTQADGSYSYTWTAPSSLPNGHYVISATYTGNNNPYQSSTAETTVGGGGLFVVPEYALGALGAVFALFAAFGLVQVRRKRNLNQ